MTEPVAWMGQTPYGTVVFWRWGERRPLTEQAKNAGWTERALVYADDLDAAEAQIKVLTEALQKAAPQDKAMDELRRAVAEIIGEDPETWPSHGNAPLAIAAVVALATKPAAPQAAPEPVAWQYRQLMHDYMGGWESKIERLDPRKSSWIKPGDLEDVVPLYTAPPAVTEAAPDEPSTDDLEYICGRWEVNQGASSLTIAVRAYVSALKAARSAR